MILVLERRTPLAGYAVATEAVSIAEAPPETILALRLDPADGEAVRQAIGVALPPPLRSTTLAPEAGPARSILWLGPDSFLVLGAAREGEGLAAELAAALAATAHQLVDISHGMVRLELAGEADAVLARLTPLDLGAVPSGGVAGTVLAKVPATLWQRERGWDVIVRRAHANFAATQLAIAAGVEPPPRPAGARYRGG